MPDVVLRLSRALLLIGLGFLVSPAQAQTKEKPPVPADLLTADQKRRAEQLTSLFENDTTDLQYGYCANLRDGRGFTAGRAGFVSSNDEVYRVVEAYAKARPENPLAGFLPRLKYLADQETADTGGLKGFPRAWKNAAQDPLFRAAQNQLVEELFWAPSLAYARALKLRTPLAIAAVHDTIIQHGNDGDADGLPALLKETEKEAGGSPATGVDEKKWLQFFLKVRRQHLSNASEPETRSEWKKSLDRCLVLEAIAQKGNYELSGPIEINSDDFEAIIP